jgi:methionyl-tRNA formyltransferase
MLKVLYAGSPLASAMVLQSLIDSSQKSSLFKICAVLTNPPSMRGRHHDLVPTEVAACAAKNQIPTLEFDHLNSEAREACEPYDFDLLVSFDYGRIFGPKFLGMFKFGGINLHPSALPKYRGCTPVPAAILNGDRELGICVQTLALKTDEGNILAQDKIQLDGSETTLFLMDGDKNSSPVTKTGAELLLKVIESIASEGKIPQGAEQEGPSSYTPFIRKEDGIINWNETADLIDRKIRAYTPWPLASTVSGDKKLLILKGEPSALAGTGGTDCAPGTVLAFDKAKGIQIACGGGTSLFVKQLQWQGKNPLDHESFMNGARDFIGSRLGDNIN